MEQLLSPRSDVGVVVQLAGAVVLWLAALWLLRRRPDARLLATGTAMVVLALVGLRAAH